MNDIDTAIRTIKERINRAQRERVRAEHERDTAQRTLTEVGARLLDEFGAATVEQARTELARLETELTDTTRRLSEALDEIGA